MSLADCPDARMPNTRKSEMISTESSKNTQGLAQAEPCRIFLSHSRVDRGMAHAIAGPLKALGFHVWIDETEIHAGDPLPERISIAITESHYLVALISDAWNASGWCQLELSLAIALGAGKNQIRVLPLRVDGAEMPPLVRNLAYLEVDSKNPLAVAEELAFHVRAHLHQRREIASAGENISAGREEQHDWLGSCLRFHTFSDQPARQGSEDSKRRFEHMRGTPWSPGCPRCEEQAATQFLASADLMDPEIAGAKAFRDGSLHSFPWVLAEAFGCEATAPDTLPLGESWAEGRQGVTDPQAVPRTIRASFTHRFEIDSPKLLSYADRAAQLADAADDAFEQAFAHLWRSRVLGIRRELVKSAREIQAAELAVARLEEGRRRRIAEAYLSYQSADHQRRLHNFEKAREGFEQAIDRFRHLDLPGMAHYAEYGLALTYSDARRYEEARFVVRNLIRDVLATSRDKLLMSYAFRLLVGDILPGLACDGRPDLAERALYLRSVVGKEESSEASIKARNFWRDGRIAQALGAYGTALAFFTEARSLFVPDGSDVTGMYEAAYISLEIIEVILKAGGSSQKIQGAALDAAKIFHALGADTYYLMALGLSLRSETEAEAGVYLLQARTALELAEKKSLLKAAEEEADSNQP